MTTKPNSFPGVIFATRLSISVTRKYYSFSSTRKWSRHHPPIIPSSVSPPCTWFHPTKTKSAVAFSRPFQCFHQPNAKLFHHEHARHPSPIYPCDPIHEKPNASAPFPFKVSPVPLELFTVPKSIRRIDLYDNDTSSSKSYQPQRWRQIVIKIVSTSATTTQRRQNRSIPHVKVLRSRETRCRWEINIGEHR